MGEKLEAALNSSITPNLIILKLMNLMKCHLNSGFPKGVQELHCCELSDLWDRESWVHNIP